MVGSPEERCACIDHLGARVLLRVALGWIVVLIVLSVILLIR